MSTSRLEKFIYAICSMDVTDLPTPLSRIEKLWNCLITGETPDFEPLSRNEKYLMAMLNYYDINDLPTPISRGEKLLYKIVVGDTDLSDVPGYLSRYEELLKNLIENGGIGGGDFEYVLYTINKSLYTLYETAEKPVKSAILKGNTLVNLVNFDRTDAYGTSYSKDGSKITVSSTSEMAWASLDFYIEQLKPDTNYILMVDDVSFTHGGEFIVSVYYKNWNVLVQKLPSQSSKFFKFYIASDVDTSSIDTVVRIHVTLDNASISTTTVDGIRVFEYQDGMENWDIPYFEGMQSVRMPVLTTTGKNLFDGEYELDKYLEKDGTPTASADWATTKNHIRVKPNTTYTQNIHMGSPIVYVVFYDKNKNIIGAETGFDIHNFATYTTPNNCYYIKTCYKYSSVGNHLFQVEEGSISTTYEPFRSNTLTVNEDVELRGIGAVQDTLDLMTGELTENFEPFVFNGSENWVVNNDTLENTTRFILTAYAPNMVTNQNVGICNNFAWGNYDKDVPGIMISKPSGHVYLRTPKMSVDELKTTLSNNPIHGYYNKEKSIKTVDLSVVDQDSNPTKLGTFENITHVSSESEGLIPTLEIEVGTIISEELTSASPLMDDISVEQQNLSETVDEQSDNIDTTMMATTEIYENTL